MFQVPYSALLTAVSPMSVLAVSPFPILPHLVHLMADQPTSVSACSLLLYITVSYCHTYNIYGIYIMALYYHDGHYMYTFP